MCHCNYPKISYTNSNIKASTNSADTDKTAPEGAGGSKYTLFAILLCILWKKQTLGKIKNMEYKVL